MSASRRSADTDSPQGYRFVLMTNCVYFVVVACNANPDNTFLSLRAGENYTHSVVSIWASSSSSPKTGSVGCWRCPRE